MPLSIGAGWVSTYSLPATTPGTAILIGFGGPTQASQTTIIIGSGWVSTHTLTPQPVPNDVLDGAIGETQPLIETLVIGPGWVSTHLLGPFNPTVTACFTSFIPNPLTDPLEVIFNANCTAGGSGLFDYVWDFGDGTQGTGANPTHRYADLDVYRVRLLVADAFTGLTDDDVQDVEVLAGNDPPRMSREDVLNRTKGHFDYEPATMRETWTPDRQLRKQNRVTIAANATATVLTYQVLREAFIRNALIAVQSNATVRLYRNDELVTEVPVEVATPRLDLLAGGRLTLRRGDILKIEATNTTGNACPFTGTFLGTGV